MRVLVISHSARLGGSQRSLIEYVQIMVHAGFKTTVVVPEAGPMEAELLARGATTHRIPLPRWTAHRWSLGDSTAAKIEHLRSARLIEQIIRAENCSIVLTNTITVPAGAIAAKRTRRIHVWRISEFGWSDHQLLFKYGKRLTYRWMAKNSAGFIVVSNAVREVLREDEVLHIPTHVVYPPVEFQVQSHRNQRRPHKDFIVCQVGRLTPGKDPETAIRAIAACVRRGVHIRLTLVGSGADEYTARLRRLIDHEGVQASVDFAGQVSYPGRIYDRSDLSLLCSKHEAFGRVVVEAMKHGLPVIGANAGALPELIFDDINGKLFEPGDHRHLAEILVDAANSRSTVCPQMGANARAIANRRFNIANTTRALVPVLEELARRALA